jgi:hypothetical protein
VHTEDSSALAPPLGTKSTAAQHQGGHGREGVTIDLPQVDCSTCPTTWVYYNAQIVLMGAEFTRVYAEHHGSRKSSREAGRSPWPDGAVAGDDAEPHLARAVFGPILGKKSPWPLRAFWAGSAQELDGWRPT